MPRPTHISIRHEVRALAHEGMRQSAIAGRVGLVLPSTAFSGGMLPLELWCQASLWRLVGRPHPSRTCSVQDGPTWSFYRCSGLTTRMRNFYGMRAGRKTINSRLLFCAYRAYRPTRKPLLTANHCRLHLEWAQSWQNLIMAHWQRVIFGDESGFQLYLVDGRRRLHSLPGERFQHMQQDYRVKAGGGSVCIRGAFYETL